LRRCEVHGFAVGNTATRCPGSHADGSDCRLVPLVGHDPKVWWNEGGTPRWEYVSSELTGRPKATDAATAPRGPRPPWRKEPSRG
jgi:hypothetical protein